MTTRKPKPTPGAIYTTDNDGVQRAIFMPPIVRKPRPIPAKFAKGNKAASKGEPRTVPLTVRLPERIAYKLASLAYGRCSKADAVIELIDDAVPDEPAPYAGKSEHAFDCAGMIRAQLAVLRQAASKRP